MPAAASAPPASLVELSARLRLAEGWRELVAALRENRSGTIDGAWGSSSALAVAGLAHEKPPVLVVVVSHVGDVEPWREDLAGFAGKRPTWFPSWDSWPVEPSPRDEVAGQRLRLLQKIAGASERFVITTITALMQPVPAPQDLSARGRQLRVGGSVDLDELADWLVHQGYKRVDAVELPGEFSRRGGIYDIFSPDAENAVRLEFFGDEIESIRAFAVQNQRSLDAVDAVTILGQHAPHSAPPRGHFCDYLPVGSWIALIEPAELNDQGRTFLERVSSVEGLMSVNAAFAQLLKFPSVYVSTMPSSSVEATCHLRVESVERFSGNVNRVRDELDAIGANDRVLIACHNDAEVHRLTDVLAAGKLAQSDRLRLVTGHVRAGFRLIAADGPDTVILGSHQLFHRDPNPAGQAATKAAPGRRIESRAIDSFLDLNAGDYVVHVAHGIALFRGMEMLDKSTERKVALSAHHAELDQHAPAREEHLVLEFRDGVLVYVPASKIDLVQKYVGGSRSQPELSKFGGTAWQRKKDRVSEAVRDMAADMIQLQAVRATMTGFPYPVDSPWQKEFEATFPYQETPDQLSAIVEIKGDMEKPRSMDRLLCGDVGYGKTEVAIRACFKAIDNGKQVAVLVPTTVLAEQHYRTFRQRLAEYPFTVEVLSRFRSAGEQKRILQSLAKGAVDVIIGTHRLVSNDIRFKDLGLVIIDEEQRFGVEHKERLKQLRATVDVLTLSATPIPRTLHLALLGVRDISNLETPPPERLPVETRIVRFDPQLIRHAILRELNREGQVYFVHNRVYDIDKIAEQVKVIVPEAKIVVAHGQMAEGGLEKAMVKFVQREADILVATTIIESGLDIPNANTIFINEAENYGLADLHQLRGRVGRQKNRAYAYLLVSADKHVSDTAAKRLKAIEEFTDLGAGFRIAMRDLEIRGAGNILGSEQSGHIASVGYELYCQLLDNAVRTVKKQPLKTAIEVNVDLPWPAFLPREYVTGQKLRIEVYRRLARIRDPRKLEDFRQELRDRYGPPPEETEWMLRLAEIRLWAAKWQITTIHRDGPYVVFSYRNPRRIHQLADASATRLRVVDEKQAYLKLVPSEEEPNALYDLLCSLLRTTKESV